MIDIKTCPVCGQGDFKPFLTCKDFTVSKESFSLVQCSTCSMVITNPRPSDHDLGKYYLSEEYISHTSKANNLVNQLYIIARSFTLKKKKRLASNLFPSKGKLLDIGCGTGDFLKICAEDGWQSTGIEPGEQPRNLARQKGLTAYQSLQEVNGTFSFITLWHVLEHIPDLPQTLNKVYSLLEKDGRLLIAVPNYKSLDAAIYQEHWAGYDVPRHLWHFSQETMERLLLNHQFHLVKKMPMVLDSYYVSLLSETYKKTGLLRFPKSLFNGLRSNLRSKQNQEYSSIIYIFRK